MPESNLPSGAPSSSDVAVCATESSSFIHVTVAPVVTITEFGWYASSVRLEEPGTIETESLGFCCCGCSCYCCCPPTIVAKASVLISKSPTV
jgi:hypothetical protein